MNSDISVTRTRPARKATGKLRPHDLLLLTELPEITHAAGWVQEALVRWPFVVVRRGPHGAGRVAVGVRGEERNQRLATWICPHQIGQILTPTDLAQNSPAVHRSVLPAFRLLRAVAAVFHENDLNWGPAGSAGFELASGAPSVRQESDLDVVIRSPSRIGRSKSIEIFEKLSMVERDIKGRVDVQIDTLDGLFSLREFAQTSGNVMMRFPEGPLLVTDPWCARAQPAYG